MTTSEPTTGEIVRALRFCYESEEIECYECPCRVSGGAYLCHMDKLADRFESQERELSGISGELKAMTARAEQAEAREKAAIERMRGSCQFCIGYEREEDEEPCNTCTNARTFEPDDVERTDNWEYRGLPQEGEGK